MHYLCIFVEWSAKSQHTHTTQTEQIAWLIIYFFCLVPNSSSLLVLHIAYNTWLQSHIIYFYSLAVSYSLRWSDNVFYQIDFLSIKADMTNTNANSDCLMLPRIHGDPVLYGSKGLSFWLNYRRMMSSCCAVNNVKCVSVGRTARGVPGDRMPAPVFWARRLRVKPLSVYDKQCRGVRKTQLLKDWKILSLQSKDIGLRVDNHFRGTALDQQPAGGRF